MHAKIALTHGAGTAAGTAAFAFGPGYRPNETMTFVGSDAAGLAVAMTVDAAGSLANLAVLAAAAQVRMSFSFLAEF